MWTERKEQIKWEVTSGRWIPLTDENWFLDLGGGTHPHTWRRGESRWRGPGEVTRLSMHLNSQLRPALEKGKGFSLYPYHICLEESCLKTHLENEDTVAL